MNDKTLLLSALILTAFATERPQSPRQQGHKKSAIIKITINPEGRVNAVLVGDTPSHLPCDVPVDLPVKIFNQGFITAPLNAELVDPPSSNSKVGFQSEPLKGAPEELRMLTLILRTPEDEDFTIAFRAERPDLDQSDNNRVHFVIRCENPSKST
jgi:hypothetical protein